MKRIGVIVPSSNASLEPDLVRLLADVATVHGTRLSLSAPVTPEARLRMLERAEPAAAELGDLEPDVVVFGCTTAAAVLGLEGTAALMARLSRITGAPVLGVLESLRAALLRIGARRVGLLAPYAETGLRDVQRSLEAMRFDVPSAVGMGHDDNRRISRIAVPQILEAAGRLDVRGADAIVVACTNLRALDARGPLVERLGRPVVTANWAIADAVRRVLA